MNVLGDHSFSPVQSRLTAARLPLSIVQIGIANTATNVPWISHVSDAASSGIPQAIVLGVSGLFLASPLLRCQWPTSQLRPFSKASGIRYKYEILSQVARASALSFMAVAFFHNRAHLLDAILLGYAFLLGLTRLFADVLWRRAALHQVNFVLVSQLVLLCIAQFLPCIGLNHSCTRDTGVIGSAAALAVALLIAMLTPREWVQPQLAEEIPGFGIPDEPAPEEVCGWLDYYCTYQWLNPVIWKGTLRKLDMSDIPRLAWYDDPLYLLRQVQDARAACKSTFWTTLRFQRTELLLMSLWIGSAFIVENVAPFGMFNLLAYLDNPDAADYKPWVWLLLTFFGPLLRSVLFQGYVFTSTRLIVRVKSAVTQELYHKALASMEIEDDPFSESLDAASRENETDVNRTKSTSAGRLANLMAADVDAIFRSRDMIMVIVGLPAGSIVSFIGLYRMLGWTSVVGISILILVVPISIYLGKMMYNMQKKVRQAQDSRISLVTEYLASIKAIKYFGWEKPATAKIIQSRAIEQKGLWNLSVLQIVINQVTQVLPLLSLLIMFFLHVIVDKRRLTASTAFTTVYLADHIRRNIMMASMFSRKFAATLVAFKRLDRYFASAVPLIKYPEGPLRLVKASFRRNKKANFWLDEISIDFVEGGLNVITGQSGSGKTTLLLSILGETYLEGGSVTAPSDVAYASQTSWLQNQTIRENILFGSPMERLRYDTIVAACCLPQDFRDLPNRDQTTVGENGTSLSGGQKARVALARALYSKAPLLLLDDIFSALDPRTSAGVWKDCFCSDLLKGRTTVLVTQVPWISAQADLAILLERGRVKEAEANIGISRKPIKIADVFAGDADDSSLTEIETPPDPELQADGDALNDPSKVAQDVPVQDIVDQEAKASGAFSRWSVFQYMRYFGHPLFAASCCLGLALSNAFTFGTTYWLSIWVEADDGESDVNVAYYLTIFAVIIFLDLVVFGAVIAIFEWGGWRAARRLHNEFIRAVMRVPLSWYKTIPVGRITNRFSGDMTSIDGTLSGMMRSTVDIFLSFFFRLGAVSSIMPIFMIPALITCLFGVMFGEMYTRTAVVVQRLTSSAQSPVFSQFADTLAGLSIIRARSGKAKEFGFGLADKFRTWSAVAETNYNCNRWVSIRIDFVTSLVSLFAGAIAISRAGLVGAGLVGFSLTNANDLSSTVLYLVRSMNDLEVEMQSFHRVKEYVKLEPEGKDDEHYPDEDEVEYVDDDRRVIPRDWPRSGEVEFRNVTIRYDPGGPDILTDVNLKFKAGERVAVVGRTGSGKSTLVLSLLRFTHIVSGEILFDGVDITKVARHRLRESVTIIPQEAVLFNGSIESNLDPTGMVPRERLESALDSCKGIASFSGDAALSSEGNDAGAADARHVQAVTLSTAVEARGENFSHGQRQVLSLCRALIRKSKLMLLDEATASMDYKTDRGIQQVLRDDLEAADDNRTLVTIAHRLRTIIDYDCVVVMSSGRVVEHGSPKELYDAKGQFYDMICHSGEMEELQAMLE